jgi:hypothetical protein
MSEAIRHSTHCSSVELVAPTEQQGLQGREPRRNMSYSFNLGAL